MKILSELLLLYLGIFGVTVECNLVAQIAKLLYRSQIPLTRDVYTGQLVEPCGDSDYNSFENKIAGGTDAKENEFPWQISLQVLVGRKYQHNCGAVIIHESFILTAGHCVDGINPEDLLVGAGLYDLKKNSTNSQYRKISKIYYDQYNSDNYENDIAVLELQERLHLKERIVWPICLPRGNEEYFGKIVAAGWGRLQENGSLPTVLQTVQLDKIDYTKCEEIYTKKGFDFFLHNCQICTLSSNKDTCQGDSGGSLMCLDEKSKKTFTCGVISWGLGCNRNMTPGVSTDTKCFTKWIMQKVNNN